MNLITAFIDFSYAQMVYTMIMYTVLSHNSGT